jgi:phosphoribosylformimino-5-aminoimidazole carboxamide ribotide isomerase
MQLYPAIDIKDGKCVRLQQGKFDQVTVYNDNPAAAAENWLSQGATYLHVVDLDGARLGSGYNNEAIAKITAAAGEIPVQVGGGIRTMRDIEEKLELGVSRVILGTAAINDPSFVKEAVKAFGSKIAVGVDAKNGRVAISGWEELSDKTAISLCLEMAALGVKTVIYTDISKDGMMQGPNVESTKELIEAAPMLNIIASGGVSEMADLENIEAIGAPGVIIGKALYKGTIDLKQALQKYEGKNN